MKLFDIRIEFFRADMSDFSRYTESITVYGFDNAVEFATKIAAAINIVNAIVIDAFTGEILWEKM